MDSSVGTQPTQPKSTQDKSTSPRLIAWYGIAWTVVFEVITCLLRFGMQLESTRDTASTIGRITFGLRIHHSYIGVAMIPLAILFEKRWPRLAFHILAIGAGLFFSDMIHHFIVLWLVTGSPQFDLVYGP